MFFMNHLSLAPENNTRVYLKFFLFASQGASPVSTTWVANFATSSAGVVDTSANLPPVSMTQVANCHWYHDTGGQFATDVNDTNGKQWEQYQAADNLK
jgi:hypothetical protein